MSVISKNILILLDGNFNCCFVLILADNGCLPGYGQFEIWVYRELHHSFSLA